MSTGSTSSSTSSSNNNALRGLVSGMDTTALVERLMAVQRQSYDKTSEKVQAERIKLQAYQSINSMLLSLKTSVNSLSSQSLWNAKAAVSSKENALKATASSSAEAGSHSFRVGKLASSAKYLSKGFSSKDSPVIAPGATKQNGTITLESSKARVDNSARLEDLNGGKGIYRGSIRITDGRGTSAVVDLSVCETMDDIIREINGASGTQIEASITDGTKLQIVDKSGGTGALTIQNVGQGTTATDLGIAKSDASRTIIGDPVFYMSGDTSLSILNDGLGVEEGMMTITVEDPSGKFVDIDVNLNNCRTINDILSSVNNTIKGIADGTMVDENGNPLENHTFAEGLRLAINNEQNGLTFTGGKGGYTYTVAYLYGKDESGAQELYMAETASQLGLGGSYTVANDGDSFGGTRILGDVNSPMLKNLSGANKTGIATSESRPKAPALNFDENTKLADLFGGSGLRIPGDLTFGIKFAENNSDNERQFTTDLFNSSRMRAIINDKNASVGDLLDYLNEQIKSVGASALDGVEFKVDSDARGIYIDGLKSTNSYQFGGTLADMLGLAVAMVGPDADQNGLDDLYDVRQIVQNEGDLRDSAKLNELYIGGTQITQGQMDDILQNPLNITIGNGGTDINVSIDLSGFDENTAIIDIVDHINAEIESQVKAADPDANVPQLRTDFWSKGLDWYNIDQSEKFEVSGVGSDLLGTTRTYAGQTVQTTRTDVQMNLNPVQTGTYTETDVTGTDLLSSLNGGKGLSFNGGTLSLTFGDAGNSATVNVTQQELLDALGNFGARTVQDYTTALTNLFNAKIAAHVDLGAGVEVEFGIHPDGHGITLTNVKGRADDEVFSLGGDMAYGGSTGLAAFEGKAHSSAYQMPGHDDVADIRSVITTPGTVTGMGGIKMTIGGTPVELSVDGLTENSTLNDLIAKLNEGLEGKGYTDMFFGVSSSGTGLSFTNNSTKEVTIHFDEMDTLASDLGLVGKAGEGTDTVISARSYHNGTSVNRNYISRATSLSSLNGGLGADTGTITLTDPLGYSVNIDLSNCKTVGDVIDAINGLGSPDVVYAAINEAGDGIALYQIGDDMSAVGNDRTKGEITITNSDGLKTAEHLGIAGSGKGGDDGYSILDGSMKTVIEVGPNDSLTDIMTRVGTASTLYKASIINDGNPDAPHRLSIDATKSGTGNDFIIDCDLDVLGLTKASKGQDSMLLYGQENSMESPTVLRSSTNTNSKAILGLNLELTETTDSYVTITVKSDTEKVVEEIKNMVQCYNDMSDLISYLDAYDYENDTKGILNGDTVVRGLMESIDEMFYMVFNPNNLSYSEMSTSKEKSVWTWDDLGISLSTNTIAADTDNPARYQKMDLDEETLTNMVAENWDQLFDAMASQRNASNSKLAKGAAASASFNFRHQDDDGNPISSDDFWDPNNAINNDRTTGNWGPTNGFTANGTIEDGENEYTIYFQSNVTLDRVSIYHPNSADYPSGQYALRDFTVEYLDANTGKWEMLKEFSGNTGSSSIIGIPANTVAQGIRITATSTNAEDGKFRLLDVQCLESTGLAGKLNQKVNSITDVVDGYFTNANKDVENKIKDLQDQMEKMAERLEAKEEALWRKFSAMETALSKLNSQGDYLSSYFASVNKK